MADRVRLGIVGGHRGGAFDRALDVLSESVQVTAICDLSEDVLAQWRARHPGISTTTSYDELLDNDDCTAVFIATPYRLHARQSIQALQAGKHVLSEVVAATTLEECWELVETVESSGLTYMLAENYCYTRPNMMVLNMVQQGVFGRLTHAEGAYIHDCRGLLLNDDQTLTWRGESRRLPPQNGYPTHSLGPIARWLNCNRHGGDRLASTATWVTPSYAIGNYMADRLGAEHPLAEQSQWTMSDSATTVIQTANGVVIVLRVDYASPRPHNMTHYVLQGEQASYISARHHQEDDLVWIDGVSPGTSPSGEAAWEPLYTHSDTYEHPEWRTWQEAAAQSGHGGGDLFVLKDFSQAILQGTRPPIDVYDAVTWSSLVPLSAASVARGGRPIDIPDFD